MVGRARSKGCITCRSRHVKCDEGKPACLRCRRGRIVCEGYADHFVDHTKQYTNASFQSYSPNTYLPAVPIPSELLFITQNRHAKLRPANSNLSISSSSTSSSSSSSDDDDHRQCVLNVLKDVGSLSTVPSKAQTQIPSQMNLKAWEDTIYTAYTIEVLFKGIHNESEFHIGSHTVWVLIDHVKATQSPLTTMCLTALSSSFFGKRNPESKALKKSRLLYGRCLTELNQKLSDPEQCLETNTLVAVLLHGFYEMMNFTNTSGWMNHALGLTKLMDARGPESFMSPENLRLFENARYYITIASASARRDTCLSQERWKTIPWSLNPSAKPLIQRLMDLSVGFGGLLARVAQIVMLGTEQLSEYEAFVLETEIDLQNTFVQLNAWRDEWLDSYSHTVHERPRQIDLDSLFDEPLNFETEFTFDHVIIAHCVTSYLNSVIILANSVAQFTAVTKRNPILDVQFDEFSNLRIHDSPADTIMTPCLPLGNPMQTIYAAGSAICQTVQFHLEERHDGAGMMFLIGPIRMAHPAVGGNTTPEGRWLARIMDHIGSDQAGGWDIAKEIVRYNFEDHPVELIS